MPIASERGIMFNYYWISPFTCMDNVEFKVLGGILQQRNTIIEIPSRYDKFLSDIKQNSKTLKYGVYSDISEKNLTFMFY